jgi:DNA polymerase IIIc chi subunit
LIEKKERRKIQTNFIYLLRWNRKIRNRDAIMQMLVELWNLYTTQMDEKNKEKLAIILWQKSRLPHIPHKLKVLTGVM